jgi:hypothetical protein
LGSTKILFRTHVFRLTELSDVPCAARILKRKIKLRTYLGSTVVWSEAAIFSWCTIVNPHAVQRSGYALTAVAMLFWAYQLFSRRPQVVPNELSACITSYKIELERQRDFFRGCWLWARLVVVLPGITLFCYGGIVSHLGSRSIYFTVAAAFVFLLLVAIPNSLRMSRGFQRQLDDLHAVQGKSE